jgi:hypothetical protein
MNHETELVKAFITPLKRSRYFSLLESPKGRLKLIKELDHFGDLDMHYAKLIPMSQQSADGIERLLKQKGAPAICHVMSVNSNIDNQELSLCKALEETVGRGMGTVISCIPGKLAYFEDEEPNERYILERSV